MQWIRTHCAQNLPRFQRNKTKQSTPVYLESIKVLLLRRNVGAELRQHLRALGLVTRVQRAHLDLHRLHLCACVRLRECA
jgi:hypothetical protein